MGAERTAIIEGTGDFDKLRFISRIDKFIATVIYIAVDIALYILRTKL